MITFHVQEVQDQRSGPLNIRDYIQPLGKCNPLPVLRAAVGQILPGPQHVGKEAEPKKRFA